MKPENAHFISLCWHSVWLVFFLGSSGVFLGRIEGEPGNMTQSWAIRVKELATAGRLGGKHAWPLCYARWGVPSSRHPVTPGKLRWLHNKTLWLQEGSSIAFGLRAWQGVLFLQVRIFLEGALPGAYFLKKWFPVNLSLKTFQLQRTTWKRGRNGESQVFKNADNFQIPVN